MTERTSTDLVFAALADPTRRDLLRMVLAKGPLSTAELADGRPMSRQAVAKHLTTLTDAGLLKVIRHGRETSYDSTKRGMNPAAKWLRDAEKVQEKRQERLDKAAAKKR